MIFGSVARGQPSRGPLGPLGGRLPAPADPPPRHSAGAVKRKMLQIKKRLGIGRRRRSQLSVPSSSGNKLQHQSQTASAMDYIGFQSPPHRGTNCVTVQGMDCGRMGEWIVVIMRRQATATEPGVAATAQWSLE